MIGFIRVADIPKILISLLVGSVLLCVLFGLSSFVGIRKWPTAIAQVTFLIVFACVFYLSVKIGDYLWDRIEGMRESRLRPELQQMIATELRIRQLKREAEANNDFARRRKKNESRDHGKGD